MAAAVTSTLLVPRRSDASAGDGTGPNRPPSFSAVDFGIPPALLEAYASALSLPDAAAGVLHLAAVLARSSFWRELSSGFLCVRTDGPLRLAVVGAWDSSARSRITLRVDALHASLRHFLYLDHASVLEGVAALAQALRARLGDEFLRSCRFTGLPRGGWIVLGWLAYALDLSPAQFLDPLDADDAPVVVVDDCAITGARFGEWLDRHPGRRVIFATLCAPFATRQSIEASEARVLAAVSARDLGDYGEAELGPELANWRQEWSRRLNGRRYWVGRTDHVCFPWNEPDRSVFDPVTQRVEPAWPLTHVPFPPNTVPEISLTRIPGAPGALCPAPGVVYGSVGEGMVVSHLPLGSSVELRETAAEFWDTLMSASTRGEALSVLQQRYPECAEEVADDFRAFIRDLEARRFLEPEPRH